MLSEVGCFSPPTVRRIDWNKDLGLQRLFIPEKQDTEHVDLTDIRQTNFPAAFVARADVSDKH